MGGTRSSGTRRYVYVGQFAWARTVDSWLTGGWGFINQKSTLLGSSSRNEAQGSRVRFCACDVLCWGTRGVGAFRRGKAIPARLAPPLFLQPVTN